MITLTKSKTEWLLFGMKLLKENVLPFDVLNEKCIVVAEKLENVLKNNVDRISIGGDNI